MVKSRAVILAAFALCLGGCGGDAALRASGRALAANDALLSPYTLAGIDAAEADGTLAPGNAELARELVDANQRLIRELAEGRAAP